MFFLTRYSSLFQVLLMLLYLPFVHAESSVDVCVEKHCSATHPSFNSNSLVDCKDKMAEVGLLAERGGSSSSVEGGLSDWSGRGLERCNLNLDDIVGRYEQGVFSDDDHCLLHTPRHQATDVPVGALIAIKSHLNSSLWKELSGNSIVLKNNKSTVSTTACQVNDVVILKPDFLLEPFSLYTVIVTPDVVDPTEQAASNYSWSFTTAGQDLPLRDLWEMNMVKLGGKWGRYLEKYYPKPRSYNESKGIYYDAQRVYFQIASYSGDREPWEQYAEEAERIYRTYLDSRGWITQGWRKFPHGFYLDWLRSGSQSDRQALDRKSVV